MGVTAYCSKAKELPREAESAGDTEPLREQKKLERFELRRARGEVKLTFANMK